MEFDVFLLSALLLFVLFRYYLLLGFFPDTFSYESYGVGMPRFPSVVFIFAVNGGCISCLIFFPSKLPLLSNGHAVKNTTILSSPSIAPAVRVSAVLYPRTYITPGLFCVLSSPVYCCLSCMFLLPREYVHHGSSGREYEVEGLCFALTAA